MSSRTLEAPGVELKEIDRSRKQKEDYSLPNAPACLVTGFAPKGEDYTVQWINTKDTFVEYFGTPTNEPETWFYNAANEILNRGGIALAAKLPYDNASLQRYTWRQWKFDDFITPITVGSDEDFPPVMKIRDIRDNLQKVLAVLKSLHKKSDYLTNTIGQMWTAIKSIAEDEFGARIGTKTIEVGGQTYIAETIVFPESIDQSEFANTVKGCAEALEVITQNIAVSPYAILWYNDQEITSYLNIEDDGSGMSELDILDKHLTYSKALLKNRIRIYDITRHQYDEYDVQNCVSSFVEDETQAQALWTNDCLGYVPVLVTAPNAMYFQQILKTAEEDSKIKLDSSKFNVLSGFGTLESGKFDQNHRITDLVSTFFDPINLSDDWVTIPIKSRDVAEESVSKEAALAFPAINWRDQDHFEKDYLKHIGVVVFKAFKDLANDSRISFQPVEAYVGSLDRAAKDKISHASIFIDDVVNSRSKTIRLFSNIDRKNIERTSTLAICNQRATSLGFYKIQCKKKISLQTSITDALTKVLEQCRDPNTVPLDLVVDAGVSNLAQLIKSVSPNSLEIDFDVYPRISDFGTGFAETLCTCGCMRESSGQARAWRLESEDDTKAWRSILKKFDDFCKYTRRDCLFLADGLRTFCLEGDEKLVRKTKPSSTVENTIVPKVKYMANALNSSYAAGWCNWFYMLDSYSGDFFWCPPSIKAASICIYCDTYFHPWEAPAGMTRGIVPNAVDCAFSPTNAEAGKMYNHQWNYAINYPIEGIIMEGQKTFQTEKTALDRVNVRRLMLDLEKRTVQVARHFLYEGNTSWLRQRFVDQIKPIFEDAVTGNGILDYAIKCDEELNTMETIENHELHCKIGIKPVKTLEWIVLTFIVTRQGADVQEEVMR